MRDLLLDEEMHGGFPENVPLYCRCRREGRSVTEGKGGEGKEEKIHGKFLPLLEQTGVMCIYAVHVALVVA